MKSSVAKLCCAAASCGRRQELACRSVIFNFVYMDKVTCILEMDASNTVCYILSSV